MTYYRINLNQLEDRSAALKRKRLQSIGFVALALLFAAVATAAVWDNLVLSEKKRNLAATVGDLKQQIRAVEEGESYIGEEDVLDLYELTQERIFWTEKLEALAVVVDTAVALTGISYGTSRLRLTGITLLPDKTSRFSAISSFIDVLKSQPTFANDFPRIEFSSSDRTRFMDREIMQFEVICNRE